MAQQGSAVPPPEWEALLDGLLEGQKRTLGLIESLEQRVRQMETLYERLITTRQ